MEQLKAALLHLWLPLSRLLGSSKFWTLLIAVAMSYGLELSAEMQALILLVAATVFAGTTAIEDAALKRNGSADKSWKRRS